MRRTSHRSNADRHIPTMSEVQNAYHRYGTHIASHKDTAFFIRLLKAADQASTQQPDRKYYYTGWLNYELATVTEQSSQSSLLAQRYYQKARKGVAAAAQLDPQPHHVVRTVKSLLLMDLSSSLPGSDEATKGMNQRAAIKALGQQTIKLANEVSSANIDPVHRTYLSGELSEVAFAGVLLSLPQSAVPALHVATPRQDAPYTPGYRGYGRSIPDVEQISAFDFVYRAPIADPRRIQVKTRMHHETDEHRYDSDITVLFADRDLFVNKPHEFAELGTALMHYARSGEATRQLELAHSNVQLAFETRNALHTAKVV